MKHLELTRTFANDKQTLGQLNVIDGDNLIYSCSSLELPWLNNQVKISCVPVGEYWVKKRISPKFGLSFILEYVEGRSYILIHAGNYHTQILGCILIGKGLKDIDSDGYADVYSSRKANDEVLELMPERFKLIIK